MKMLNIFSKNNVARDTFKEVSEFMETSNFEEQVRSLVKSLKIPEGFLMKSEILVVKYSESTTEENLFSEKSWLNLVDFLKTQLKLYEESSDKESVQDYIVKTIKSQCYSDSGYGKNNNIDSISYLISYIDENAISYDIKEKKLVMTTLMKDCNCYDDNNNEYRFQCDHYGYVNGIVNTDLLRLLKMDYFGNFYNLCQNLDKEYCLKLLKYAIGLEDETWLTSFIVSEIKNNFKNVVESWAVESLKFHSKIFRLDLFPYNFYKGGNFKVNKDFYYESTITAAMSKMSLDGKYGSVDELIDYYKNLLTTIINKDYDSIFQVDECECKCSDCQDGDCEYCDECECEPQKSWKEMDYPMDEWEAIAKSVKFTNLDLKKMREELTPLLEQAFDNMIFSEIFTVSNYYNNCNKPNGAEGLYDYFNLNVLSDLLYHIKWFPSKFNLAKIVYNEEHLLEAVEKLSFAKHLKEFENVECNTSVILSQGVTEYYSDKLPKLEKLVKDKLGDNAQLVVYGTPEFEDQIKSAELVDLAPKYRIQRI